METEAKIKRFIDEELLVDLSALPGFTAPADALVAGLLDSLAIERLIAFVNEEFEITVDDDELTADRFASVPTFAQLVDSKRAARTAS